MHAHNTGIRPGIARRTTAGLTLKLGVGSGPVLFRLPLALILISTSAWLASIRLCEPVE